MTLYKVAHSKVGDLLWLDVSLDKDYVQKFCQAPRKMPGDRALCARSRAGYSKTKSHGTERHFVILLEKDFSMQKAFHAVNDFDVKVLSPTVGVFWVPCNYLLTLEEYSQHLLDCKKKKNEKKSATK